MSRRRRTMLCMMLSNWSPPSRWTRSQLLFRMGAAWGHLPIGRVLRGARKTSFCRFVNGGERCFSRWVFLRGFACTLRQEPTPALSLTRRYSSFVMLLMISPLRAERCQCLGTCPVDSRTAWRPYIASVACFQTRTWHCSLPLLRVCPHRL